MAVVAVIIRGGQWNDIHALAGIPAGDPIKMQNFTRRNLFVTDGPDPSVGGDFNFSRAFVLPHGKFVKTNQGDGLLVYFSSDLSESLNVSVSEISSTSVLDGRVATFASLPDPATNTGKVYLVEASTGVIFVNRKKRGVYKSDGASWSYLNLFTASQVVYDNSISGLTSNNVKKALDEIVAGGTNGAQGAQGEKGDQGNAGTNGTNGTNGAQGAQGEKGDQGDTGPIGQTGPQGDQGNAGPAGNDGTNGMNGATGPQGEKGDKGDPGADGQDGSASGGLEGFETLSQNLKAYDSEFSYVNGEIEKVTYALGSGQSIVKTLNYSNKNISSVVLSGDVPDGINLTKRISYDGDGNVLSAVYS